MAEGKSDVLVPLEGFYAVYNDNQFNILIILQKAKQSLQDFIAGNDLLSFNELFPILKNGIATLVFLHGKGVVHRDIKPDNMLQMLNGNWVLADYGIGYSLKDKLNNLSKVIRISYTCDSVNMKFS